MNAKINFLNDKKSEIKTKPDTEKAEEKKKEDDDQFGAVVSLEKGMYIYIYIKIIYVS